MTTEICIPEIVEETVKTTFYASKEDTYFIWLEQYGEVEAKKRWVQCCGDEPVPVITLNV